AAPPRVQGKEDVRPDPLLEQGPVLDVAVLVDEVALKEGRVVEEHGAGSAAHHGDHVAQAPPRAARVADHLDVVPGGVHEAAGEAVELVEGAQLLGERGHHRLQLAACGEGGGDAV